MVGYCKVSLDAAKALTLKEYGPELLGAYIVLVNHAYGDRQVTAAGAQCIEKRLGVSNYRAKALLRKLLGLDPAHQGDSRFLVPTSAKRLNASIHEIVDWPGSVAYFPGPLIDDRLKIICRATEVTGPETTRRDALLVLAHVYSHVSYADWCGVPPEQLASIELTLEGAVIGRPRGSKATLGKVDTFGAMELWCGQLRRPPNWQISDRTATNLFGSPDEKPRIQAAINYLIRRRFLMPVIAVSDSRETYPIWVSGKAIREYLNINLQVSASLSRKATALAVKTRKWQKTEFGSGIRDRPDRYGSGIYLALSYGRPCIRAVLTPRVIALTPGNLSALKELAAVTQRRERQIGEVMPKRHIHGLV